MLHSCDVLDSAMVSHCPLQVRPLGQRQLVEVNGVITLAPHRPWWLPVTYLLPTTVEVRADIKVGVTGSLENGQVNATHPSCKQTTLHNLSTGIHHFCVHQTHTHTDCCQMQHMIYAPLPADPCWTEGIIILPGWLLLIAVNVSSTHTLASP